MPFGTLSSSHAVVAFLLFIVHLWFLRFPNFFWHVLPQTYPQAQGKCPGAWCGTRPPCRIDQAKERITHVAIRPAFPIPVPQRTGNAELLGEELDRLSFFVKAMEHVTQVM